MAKDNIIGVYCIENKIDSKKYIGLSIDIERRWKEHRVNGRNPNKYNKPLYSAINKYGEENFNFYILEECSIEELECREIKYIEKFNTTDRKFGYNLESGGYSNIVVNELTKKKLRNSQPNRIPVVQLDRYGNFIAEFKSLQLASDITKTDRRQLTAVCKNKSKFANNFIFVFKKDYDKEDFKIDKNSFIVKLSLDGDYIREYFTASEASRVENISSANISLCCNPSNSRLICNGYLWVKYNHYVSGQYKLPTHENINKFKISNSKDFRNGKPVIQMDKKGKIINEFESIAIASKVTDSSKSGIALACRGVYSHSNNFVWKYKKPLER